ncbi:MAG: TRAP transporter fused permease subunit [Proteobacteria bacterium]|nr:TRAP transporter fused permease subunit [Pseudomonadota bacterium]MDA1324288.1 TRAP transporter fused permease subunit [Pseudomonadota bacterium]
MSENKDEQAVGLPRPIEAIKTGICLVMFVVQVWTVLTWQLDDAEIRGLFLGFILLFSFAFYPATKKSRSRFAFAVDLAMVALSLYVTLYVVLDFEEVFGRAGDILFQDYVVGILAVLLVLEATRRTTGWALPILSFVFILYPLVYGPYMPGVLYTANFGFERVLTLLYLSLGGILGVAFKVTLEFIFLFIIFGAFLNRFGIAELFIDFARAVAGTSRGGSAKVAVVASALMGTVNGSATANVASTGVLTIPMMKREGFSPTFAGAVEAAASTGGQIMPPIMGAAAFLMVEFARISYSDIIIHAFLPAVFYFAMVWAAVHFEAIRLGLARAARESLPEMWPILKRRGGGFLPIVFLTAMIMFRQPLMDSVLWSLVLTVVIAFVTPDLRKYVTLENLIGAVTDGVKTAIPLLMASACAGIVIGTVMLTSLSINISAMIVEMSQGIAIVALVLSAICCLIMGLGLPTQIIYLTLAILVAPGLVDMGISVAGAHLFIIYFGMMSMVTPPVCFAAFTAATLAGANLMKTGIVAFRIALAGQLVPFYFALNPGLLLIGSVTDIAIAIIRTSAGLFAAGLAFEIFRLWPVDHDATLPRLLIYGRRLVFFISGIALIFPTALPTVIGLVALIFGLLIVFLITRTQRPAVTGS